MNIAPPTLSPETQDAEPWTLTSKPSTVNTKAYTGNAKPETFPHSPKPETLCA
jgi:hypothetical protein